MARRKSGADSVYDELVAAGAAEVAGVESEAVDEKHVTGLASLNIGPNDYVAGKERFPDPIPVDEVSDEPTHVLYEIIDDWRGWRIEVRGAWHPIKNLRLIEEVNRVSVLAGGLVTDYDKETPVIR